MNEKKGFHIERNVVPSIQVWHWQTKWINIYD
jgi:hypothetical protein